LNSEKRWIGVFSALLLLLGIFFGIAMDRFLFRPEPPAAPIGAGPPGGDRRPHGAAGFFLDRIVSELDLTEAQRAQVQDVFRRNLPLLRAARGDRRSFQDARHRMRQELAGVLSEEQLKKFDELRRRERDQMRRERDLPPGGGGTRPPGN